MSSVTPFPARAFTTPGEAAQFASTVFIEKIVPLREKAVVSGDRTQIQTVIEIYERDAIPNNSRYLGHLAQDLLNFGQWLGDIALLDRAISILRAGPPLDSVFTKTEKKARGSHNAALGRALVLRGEYEPNGPFFEEAALLYEETLKDWREFDQFACCSFSVNLGRAYVALGVRDECERQVEAGLAAFASANPIHPMMGRSLDLAHQRLSEAKSALFFIERGKPNTSAGLEGIDEAIGIFRQWDSPYVIPPIWIERAERLRGTLAAKLRAT